MAEPEIARRCHACGASIRDRAFFCPQCGKELKTTADLNERDPDNNKPSTAVNTAPLHEAPIQKEQLTTERSAATPGKQAMIDVAKPEAPSPPEPTSKAAAGRGKGTPEQTGKAKGTPDQASKTKGTPGSHVFADARGKMQRATGLAKNVGGDVVQRGQKLREMSSVVLDEAGYDPSLRFVLVAALLFVLFLVMMLLNRFIV
ncbi:MAG: hypothetical protein H7Z16_08605 [Pyrinomonadaceae bacterium]|nr:hypothetical protein [Pyrinomonadaceae bacterium]